MIDRLEETHRAAERDKYTADWQKLALEYGLRPERCGPNAVLALQLSAARIEGYKVAINALLDKVGNANELSPSAVPAHLQQK